MRSLLLLAALCALALAAQASPLEKTSCTLQETLACNNEIQGGFIALALLMFFNDSMILILSDKKIDELQFKILIILMTIVISQHYF